MTHYVQDVDLTLYNGDALTVLRELPSGSVNCVVTSPPYWGLRDYGVNGQLGLESSPSEYVEAMRDVFSEVRRVLRADGTLWLNLGDSYAGGGNGARDPERWPKQHRNANGFRSTHIKKNHGIKTKDLVGIPWRVAFALQDDGWYLRCDVIWNKPNPMPESVADRPTRAHEYVFLLAKSERYHYDAAAIAEPATWFGPNGSPKSGPHSNGQMVSRAGAKRPQMRRAAELAAQHGLTEAHFEAMRAAGISDAGQALALRESGDIPLTRNKRSVWEVQTMQYADAHFAVFPEKLIEPCILAGCPEGGVVLDPFFGSGTTGVVARRHGRRTVGIELNESYCAMAAARLGQQSLLAEPAA